jgi:hypothetical protein
MRRLGRLVLNLAATGVLVAVFTVLLATLTVDLPAGPAGPRSAGEWVGPVHAHTVASHDGGGTRAQVGEAAAELGFDFVLVSEHNSGVSDAVEEGSVLLVVGEEASTGAGHLVVYGAGDGWRDHDDRSLRDARTTLDLARAGGSGGLRRPEGSIVILSHPTGPNRWKEPEIREVDGLEIWNADMEWRAGDGFFDWLYALGSIPFRSEAALAHLLDRPDEALAWWDDLLRDGPRMGLCAVDAHARIDITDTWFVRLPSYRQVFALAQQHILVGRGRSADPRADALAILDALVQGRSYCAFGMLADGSGLKMEVSAGSRRAGLGDSVPWSEGSTLQVELPPAGESARTVLMMDGEQVDEAEGRTMSFQLPGPGTYRLETFLPRPGLLRRGWAPWILTNPVYLTGPAASGAIP